MAFNAYLVFHERPKSRANPPPNPKRRQKEKGAVEIADYGFGVSMPVTASRSDGGGATVGRANFDVFHLQQKH